LECDEKLHRVGLRTEGVLPGYLKVQRRRLHSPGGLNINEGDQSLDALQAYAIAVNEENAAGNRVVTAPTNGRLALFRRWGFML
jgi:L-serine dehydratase